MLDKAKTDYEELKKTVDELRASEVSSNEFSLILAAFWYIYVSTGVTYLLVMPQVDADYKLQDLKKAYKELQMKGKGYKRRLDDLHVALSQHMEQ